MDCPRCGGRLETDPRDDWIYIAVCKDCGKMFQAKLSQRFSTIDELVDWVEDQMGDRGNRLIAEKITDLMKKEGYTSFNPYSQEYGIKDDFLNDNSYNFFNLWNEAREKIESKICKLADKYQEEIDFKMNDTTYDIFLTRIIDETEDPEDLEEEIKGRLENLKIEYQK
jgi:transcription elongation factor Elf1